MNRLNFNITSARPSETWAIIGIEITEKTTDYNAEVTEEKWVIDKNTRRSVDSYGLSSGVEQTSYKGTQFLNL